jgi:hypothetical protein
MTAGQISPAPNAETGADASPAAALRAEILALVERYHAAAFPARAFVPGETPVPVSGKVFDGEDMQYLVDSGLDFWLTAGRFARDFERDFARAFGTRSATFVNSGVVGQPGRALRADVPDAQGSGRCAAATRCSPSPRASRRPSTRSCRTGSSRCSST